MGVRIVTRTHFQIDEPMYVKALVLRCASPIAGDYRERVACRFSDLRLGPAGRINRSAAGYAVDLAKRLRLLNEKFVWSELAHLMRLFSLDGGEAALPELTLAEKIVMFRIFFESDGAAMIYLARAALEMTTLPGGGQDGWNELANAMLTGIYRDCLELESEPIERMKIRAKLEQRHRSPFRGKSGAHQLFVHLQTMYRLGLVGRDSRTAGRRYVVLESVAPEPLAELVAACPGLRELESVVGEHRWPEVASRVFASQVRVGVEGRAVEQEEFLDGLREDYRKMMSTGISICPLRPLIEAFQIRRLLCGLDVPSYGASVDMLADLRRRRPRSIRFHVDYLGRPAFIVLENRA